MGLIKDQFPEFFTLIRKKEIIYADIKELTEGVSRLITSPQILKKALKMIRKRVPDTVGPRDNQVNLLVGIAEAFIKAKELKEARLTAAEIADGYARDEVLTHLTKAFIKAKDFKGARQAATAMEYLDMKVAVLLNLVDALI